MDDPFSIALNPPVLIVAFTQPQRILSWSILRPGIETARRVAWLEVRNADLPPGVDAIEVVRRRASAAGLDDAVTLVTSRDIRRHHFAHIGTEGAHARCLTTVGLSNSERVGTRLHQPPPLAGTINTLVHIGQPLTDGALIEAVSIATEARTAAVMDSGVRRNGVAVTGTGTDCIAVAAPLGENAAQYAGKHTAIGEAIGAAVYKATADGICDWLADCPGVRAGVGTLAAG